MKRSTAADWSFDETGWVLTVATDDPAREAWAGTMLALSNGAIGVRGDIEERARASTFLAHAYEQAPIHYHERLHGFAERSDTRVPVAEALGVTVTLDGMPVDFEGATSITRRTLDLRTGVLTRETRWTLADGRALTIEAERLVPLDGRPVLLRRLRAWADERAATIAPRLAPAPRHEGQTADPRIGVALASGGFATERGDDAQMVERLPGSGIGVAAVQRTRDDRTKLFVATGYAAGRERSETLIAAAEGLAEGVMADGFDATAVKQRDLLDLFWAHADLGVAGEPRLTAALRLALFHLYASTGRDGRSSAAAKGLTGEGYEGHFFWDAEAFVLPVVVMVAPEIARAMLMYRVATLDAAIANARALDHPQGALYAWRTIAGRECSAHYPSGSAQYHINAAIAFAIGLYVDATGDEAFLRDHGARVLVETARLWLALGDWGDDGCFHLRGVTGPDEYTALVDDNWYTNRMAQKHLRLAVDAARRTEFAVGEDELAAMTRAADAMHLPFDAPRGLDAQDASFLDKPRWDVAGTPKDRLPLLLHYHPMTLYRHQVAKQADLILGLVFGGEDVSRDRKVRAYDHYAPITTHDSTLSASTFAILAAEIGREDDAVRFLEETVLVDLEDRHGNTSHGVHMAALAGSWMALVWGFGGFRPGGATLRLAPTCPAAWRGYHFGLTWRGTALRVEVTRDAVTYRALSGPAITLEHHGASVTLGTDECWTGPLTP